MCDLIRKMSQHWNAPVCTGLWCNSKNDSVCWCWWSPVLHHPLPWQWGIMCLSSDRSQQRNVSIFGRLMQTLPVVVAFNRKYVLRFKLTARATCNGAVKTSSGFSPFSAHVRILCTHQVATLLSTPVQSNAIQYNSSAINSTCMKLIMFSFCWLCLKCVWGRS